MSNVFEESFMVPMAGGVQLSLRRLVARQRTPAVFLLHSLFSSSADMGVRPGGLAHTLALRGFDVWLPDLRGHGRSWPPVSEIVSGGTDIDALLWIEKDLPALIEYAEQKCGSNIGLFGGSGFGGQLLLHVLARSERLEAVRGMVFLGSSRRATLTPWRQRYLRAGMRWQLLRRGYLNGAGLHIGSAPEFAEAWDLAVRWDADDTVFASLPGMPDALYVALEGANVWGVPAAVAEFMRSLPAHDGCQITLTTKALQAKRSFHGVAQQQWLEQPGEDLAMMLAGWLRQRA